MTVPRVQLGRVFRPVLFAIALVAGCKSDQAHDDKVPSVKAPEIDRVTPAPEALAGSHVPTLDPITMHEAEIRKVLGQSSRCNFRYTSTGKPILAINLETDEAAGGGVVKLNGHLIALEPASEVRAGEGRERFSLFASPVRVTVIPDRRSREANMLFEVGQSLRVGYRGYLDCDAGSTTGIASGHE